MSDSSRYIPDLPEAGMKLIGFCRKSGKLVMGAGQVIAQVTGKRPPTVAIISSDASDRTEKQLYDKCSYRNIILARASVTGEELARLLGKSSAVMACGVADSGIASQIIKLLAESSGSENDL